MPLAKSGAALALALAACLAEVLAHPLHETLTWFDLRVYVAAGRAALHSPAMLYTWQMMPGFRFTYTPFAAVVFAAGAWLPWGVQAWLMTAASVAALGLAVWCTLTALARAVGGARASERGAGGRLGTVLAVTAVALWTEPVQRALHLGQVELLLMALVIWDLCQPGRRWWQGAGVGLAAGIKLVPLIFIPYLLLTRQYRQAAAATVTFAVTGGRGLHRAAAGLRGTGGSAPTSCGPTGPASPGSSPTSRCAGCSPAHRRAWPAVCGGGWPRPPWPAWPGSSPRPGCTGRAGRCTAGSPAR